METIIVWFSALFVTAAYTCGFFWAIGAISSFDDISFFSLENRERIVIALRKRGYYRAFRAIVSLALATGVSASWGVNGTSNYILFVAIMSSFILLAAFKFGPKLPDEEEP